MNDGRRMHWIVIGAAGVFALVAQSLLFRRFFTVFEGNELGVAWFFTTWLAWVAAGAALGRIRARWPDRLAARFELLDLVLRARVSEPKPNAKLVPLPGRLERPEVVRLDPSILAKYAKEYDFEKFRLRVRAVGDGLLLSGPGMGSFSLLPRSKAQFIVEDLEAPVTFELDADGNPLRMIGEFAPGKRLEGRACRIGVRKTG